MIYIKIEVKKSTKNKLSKLGSINSTYDAVINELIYHVDTCDKFWSKRG